MIPPSEKLRVQTSERGHVVSELHIPLLRKECAKLFRSLMESQSTVFAEREDAICSQKSDSQLSYLNVSRSGKGRVYKTTYETVDNKELVRL